VSASSTFFTGYITSPDIDTSSFQREDNSLQIVCVSYLSYLIDFR
jgi:hypothetical protein